MVFWDHSPSKRSEGPSLIAHSLQLCHTLSFCGLIGAPRFGNCEVEMAGVKLAFQADEKQESHLQQLKCKLDGLVAAEVDEAFDEVCTEPEAVHCVVYYLAGLVCRKMLKNSVC